MELLIRALNEGRRLMAKGYFSRMSKNIQLDVI
jgi:hypothetical protein